MNLLTFSLAGEVAIVTGARRGIGKAIALTFAEAGADVAVCDLIYDDGQLQAVADEISRLGRKSLAVQVDTSQKIDVDNIMRKIIREFGAIDILVNNAGIVVRAPILDTTEEDWNKIFNTDLKGYFLCSQAAGKVMKKRRKGNIISIATQYAFKTTAGMGAYGIAKAGVVMLTRVLARELSIYNIRANAIAPGIVKTEFSRSGWSNPEVLKQIEASIPLGRIAEPGDIIGPALFLASSASSYVTGHTIIVDGGGLA